jgi:hypothetical protein
VRTDALYELTAGSAAKLSGHARVGICIRSVLFPDFFVVHTHVQVNIRNRLLAIGTYKFDASAPPSSFFWFKGAKLAVEGSVVRYVVSNIPPTTTPTTTWILSTA